MSIQNEDITAKNFKLFYENIKPYLNASPPAGFTPIGTIISVMGVTAPQNYLVCDGSIYNISSYPELANYFEQQFESKNFFGGNGTTTFAVPDLRGEFLRGTGTNSHANQGSGGTVGQHQDATAIDYRTTDGTNINHINADSSYSDGQVRAYNVSGSNLSNSKWTTRPTNTSVLYCIATKNIYVDDRFDYSFEEKVVGKWVDGKPIYQKTVDCGEMPNNTTKSISHGISNMKFLVKIFGVTINNGEQLPLPYPEVASSSGWTASLYAGPTYITINTNTTWSSEGHSTFVTLQYLKTTD